MADKWTWTGDKTEWDTHLAYQYNRQGEVTRLKVRVGSETLYQHYEYNQRGLLAAVYLSTGGSYDPQTDDPEVSYTYKATGAIDKIVYKGGREADYEYTIRDWVESINNVETPGGNFAAFYDYTDNGNVEQAQFYNPDPNFDLPATHRHYRQGFTYDRLSRLTGADYGFGAAGSSAWFDVGNLSYDLAGNMESLRRADETGTLIDQLRYDYSGTSNRLQAVTDSSGIALGWDAESASFGYDANGNLISQSGKFTNIAYDHRYLPVHFYMDSGDEVIANYNADGQRILKELKGEAWTFYVMDGQQTLAVVDQSGFSHFNLFGNDVFGRYDDSGARRYYLKDHLGSTRAVVDNSGEVLESFDYYPFGLLMPKRNTTGAGTMEKFTGKERDEAIGLDYFGARYYDPALGRWHGVDPLAADYPAWSPYNYTLNNPMNLIDPDGRKVKCDTEENCQQAADDVNETHEDAGVTVKEVTQKKSALFGLITWEETHYELSAEDSEYDWGQNEYSSAVYDAIASEDVVFNVFYQETAPVGNLQNADLQDAGGGYFDPNFSRTATDIYIDPRGDTRTGTPSSVLLMHEMIGHGHSVATPKNQFDNNAHKINQHYLNKLGIKKRRGYRNAHKGYQGKVVWPAINLYRKKKGN